jgi:hypothetical protein
MAGHVACIREKRNPYRILLGKSKGKRRLGRIRSNDNIKISLREIGWSVMILICLV